MILLFVYVGGALTISFLCSVLEAALLSTRVIELEQRKSAGDAGAAALLRLKQERIDDAISAILTLNTIAHTIGATLAGAQAAKVFGEAWVGVFSAVLTLLVLIVTEIIPKTLGTVYASKLVGFVARTLKLLMAALAPVLFVTGLITRLVGRPHERGISRDELKAVLTMASREGAIEDSHGRILDNVLRLEELTLEDVMTPRVVVVMVPADGTVGELVANRAAESFTRIPVFEGGPDKVVGFVNQREVLGALARGTTDPDRPLREHVRPVPHLPETTSLDRALRELIERRAHVAVVTDEYGGTSGIATLEDMFETVLGAEIVDEFDRVAALRQLAARRRDRRLAQLGLELPVSPAEPTSD